MPSPSRSSRFLRYLKITGGLFGACVLLTAFSQGQSLLSQTIRLHNQILEKDQEISRLRSALAEETRLRKEADEERILVLTSGKNKYFVKLYQSPFLILLLSKTPQNSPKNKNPK